jgi:hypothetical protein
VGGDFIRELAATVNAPGGGALLEDPLLWLADYLHSARSTGYVQAVPDDAQREEWASNLMRTPRPLAYLTRTRGLTKRTLRRAGIGWDKRETAITIPIHNAQGEVVNLVRRPWPATTPPKYKVLAGPGMPERVQVYPLPLRPGPVLAVGGLLDALLARQHGLNAVSGTHGVDTSLDVWLPHVRGRQVAVMWDVGEEKAMYDRVKALNDAGAYARPVRLSRLAGFTGKDLTDALTGGYTAENLKALINSEYRRAK